MKKILTKIMVILLLFTVIPPVQTVFASDIDSSDIDYFLEEIATYDDATKKKLAIAAMDALINNDNPDIESLKDLIRNQTSEEEKAKVIERTGDFETALDSLYVLAEMTQSERKALLDAMNASDVPKMKSITGNYTLQIIESPNNPSNPGTVENPQQLPTQTNNSTVKGIVAKSNIEELLVLVKGRLEFNLSESTANKNAMLFKKEALQEINQAKRDISFIAGGIEMMVGSGILIGFGAQDDVELTIETLEDHTAYIPNSDSTLKQFKILDKVYNLEINKVSGDQKTKLTFKENGKISIKFPIENSSNKEKLGVYYYNEQTKDWEFIGGKLDASGKYITIELEHLSKYAVMEHNRTFKDIENHWSREAVELMASKHIINGIDEENFMPDKKIKRAEFVALLSRLLDLKNNNQVKSFEDVSADAWYYDAVMAAYEAGIINGIDDNNFGPDSDITRQQMAAIIGRVIEYSKNNKIISESANLQILDKYKDKNDMTDWAQNYLSYIIENEIMTGRQVDYFDTNGSATRAESATVIKRILDKI